MNTIYQNYREQANYISSKDELDNFIRAIEDDECLSGRQYENLRLLAIDAYYDNI